MAVHLSAAEPAERPFCPRPPRRFRRSLGSIKTHHAQLPATAAVTPREKFLMRLAIESALKFEPITSREQAELKSLTKTLNPLF